MFGKRERDNVLEVLKSGKWCSAGHYFDGDYESRVERIEEAFADYVGTEYAPAVPDGTQALQLILCGIGVKPVDEVIVPSVRFVASASTVVLVNSAPWFVGVDPDTYQLDLTK